ncbi:BolA family protein [Dechloromonas sp. ZY10]|uniref:BolA family protein n=1 Tax=Dechloromonas aquae TaxID=2664436 RepID=UPI003527FB51
MSEIPENLRARLAVLEPEAVEITDDSHRHAGHAGAREGGHYRLRIVSRQFCGRSTLARHRLVYDAVGDLMRNGIHALVIDAKTPDEL